MDVSESRPASQGTGIKSMRLNQSALTMRDPWELLSTTRRTPTISLRGSSGRHTPVRSRAGTPQTNDLTYDTLESALQMKYRRATTPDLRRGGERKFDHMKTPLTNLQYDVNPTFGHRIQRIDFSKQASRPEYLAYEVDYRETMSEESLQFKPKSKGVGMQEIEKQISRETSAKSRPWTALAMSRRDDERDYAPKVHMTRPRSLTPVDMNRQAKDRFAYLSKKMSTGQQKFYSVKWEFVEKKNPSFSMEKQKARGNLFKPSIGADLIDVMKMRNEQKGNANRVYKGPDFSKMLSRNSAAKGNYVSLQQTGLQTEGVPLKPNYHLVENRPRSAQFDEKHAMSREKREKVLAKKNTYAVELEYDVPYRSPSRGVPFQRQISRSVSPSHRLFVDLPNTVVSSLYQSPSQNQELQRSLRGSADFKRECDTRTSFYTTTDDNESRDQLSIPDAKFERSRAADTSMASNTTS